MFCIICGDGLLYMHAKYILQHGSSGRIKYLLTIRQGRHEIKERFIILLEGADGVGVGAVDASAREVETRYSVTGALKEVPDLKPAPGTVARAMHEDIVLGLKRFCDHIFPHSICSLVVIFLGLLFFLPYLSALVYINK